jgi:hypothetical protein
MRGRVEALENVNPKTFRPCIWLIRDPEETTDEARARYEREHGPIGDSPILIWVCTGVPRGKGSIACA